MPNKYAGRNKYWTLSIKPNDARDIALGAVRSYMRSMGIDPLTCDETAACAALDDLILANPGTIAAQFAEQASISQIKQFRADWRRWRKDRLSRKETA